MTDTPAPNQPLTATERSVLRAAQATHGRCSCGEVHADETEVTPAVTARMRGYLAAHPDHRFAVDDEAGLVAVIVTAPSGPPKVISCSCNLTAVLDAVGAPDATEFS